MCVSHDWLQIEHIIRKNPGITLQDFSEKNNNNSSPTADSEECPSFTVFSAAQTGIFIDLNAKKVY